MSNHKVHCVFAGSIAKDIHAISQNEDVYAGDDASQRYALADGASESYHSKLWATLLTDAWLQGGPSVGREGLIACIAKYEAECCSASLPWSKLGAYERGSYATLLGVCKRADTLRIVAIGDSIIIAVYPDGRVKSFPYQSYDEFDQRPLLLSSKLLANQELSSREKLRRCVQRWPIQAGMRILMVTDAFGHWVLRKVSDSKSIDQVLAIRSQAELHEFVENERVRRELRIDDTSMIHLEVKLA